jgi:hypothetical protein
MAVKSSSWGNRQATLLHFGHNRSSSFKFRNLHAADFVRRSDHQE